MNRRLLFLLVVVGFFLGGCSLAPLYTQPQAPIPDEWPQSLAFTGSHAEPGATKVPELSWQEFFNDEYLQKIIVMALDNNRDLRLAALNVERARGLYGIQRTELFPAINAVGAGGKQRRSSDLINSEESRTREQYSLNLGVASWEIDFFGRIRSLKDQALQEYLATEQTRRSVQITLVSELARVYLTLAADRGNLKLTKSTLDTQQASYDLIHKQYENGIATEIDLRRAQIPVDTARGDLARFSQLLAQDQNALNLLVGSPVPDKLLPTNLESVTPPAIISPGLSSEVLLRRPDIMAAEYRLKGSYASIGAARAALYPRIALTTSIGTASDDLSDLFGSGTNTWNFAPQIVMPIFDARVWAALRVNKTDRKIVLTQYEKVIQTAFREVADALAVQGTIDQQVSAQQSLVDALAETYRLSNKRYILGIDNYLGVLDAQRSLYVGQLRLISLQLTSVTNQVRLYAILGGGDNEGGSKKGGDSSYELIELENENP